MDKLNTAGNILTLVGELLCKPFRAREKAREEQTAFRSELTSRLDRISETLRGVSEDIGDLQYERLSQAQDFYVSRGWCPGAKKEMLLKMHSSYRARGRNHLSEHYEEEILRLPDKPPENLRRFLENETICRYHLDVVASARAGHGAGGCGHVGGHRAH